MYRNNYWAGIAWWRPWRRSAASENESLSAGYGVPQTDPNRWLPRPLYQSGWQKASMHRPLRSGHGPGLYRNAPSRLLLERGQAHPHGSRLQFDSAACVPDDLQKTERPAG